MQKELEFVDNHSLEKVNCSPENLLILDTETSGLDSQTDSCIEVGAVLFNVGNRAVLTQISFLLPVDDNPAESINKIPPEITRLKQPFREAIKYFNDLLDISDAMLAHNAAFDKQWFGKGLLPRINKPWICSMEDIFWPKNLNIKSRPSVRDLALAYEVPVWGAHRALTDCLYIVEVLRRCENLDELLIQALQPRQLMIAQVSYENRHLAKNAGFRWNDAIKGAWSRKMSRRDMKKLEFSVHEVEFNV